MCSHSEENDTECLGIFDAKVTKFDGSAGLKVPQIGWNNISNLKSVLFEGIPENEYVYFVHGYCVSSCDESIATTNYVTEYSSAIKKGNFYAVQFHPEKSGSAGQLILENFLKKA
jgi:imidazole glycerol-phosphate synthase subunit HisH